MEIGIETLWLFRTTVTDPIFMGSKGGVTPTMDTERTLRAVSLSDIAYKIDSLSQATLSYDIISGNGSNGIFLPGTGALFSYRLHFNLPLEDSLIVERILAGEFAVVGKRIIGDHFIIFAPFKSKKTKIDNTVVQRVLLETPYTGSMIYDLKAAPIGVARQTLPPGCTPPMAVATGFDYLFDTGMN